MEFSSNCRAGRCVVGALLAAMASGGAFVAGCGSNRRSATVAPLAPGSNILLISVDTLRADHLPPYGYARVTAPTFDRLAREGILFKAAYSAVPLTLPSHATMLTGLLPPTHGVRDNGGFYLEARHETLASRLKPGGYAAAAFVSSFVLDRRWGLSKGFDDYYDNFPVAVNDLAAMASVQRRGGDTWGQARQWIRAHAAGHFFIWLHLFDPHTPYDPPEPFRQQYADRPYDGEIAYVDSILSEVVAELTARALLEKTVIVVVADHGEGLGDHDEDEHGLLAYDSTLHVPLIIRLPHRALQGTVVDEAVSVADLVPTILDLTGASIPADLDGRSSVRLMRARASGGDALYAETLYPRLQFGWSELVSVRTDRFKLVRGQRSELYDYRADPGETRNIASAHPDVVARLEQIVNRVSTQPTARPASVDPAASDRLKALGYFAGSAPPVSAGPLADPRDKTQSFRALADARRHIEAGRDAAGIRVLQQLVISDPDLAAAHRMLRDAWTARRMEADGERWLRQQLVKKPADVRLAVDLAWLERRLGRLDAAFATLSTALTEHADDFEALVLAGEIQRDRRQFDDALGRFNSALRAAPSDNTVRMQIARTLFALGRLADAESTLSAVLAGDPHASGAHYLRAQIAERRGDGIAAEREYRAEIAQSPWDYQARFNLALILAQRAAHGEALELLKTIPPLAPHFGEVHFYIAKAMLDAGDPKGFPDAIDAARRGLQLAPDSPSAPLGHYVLGDLYRLQGRAADAEHEIRKGQELERRLLQGRSPGDR